MTGTTGSLGPLALRASADELDALAYGLTGVGFPGVGPSLVTAAAETHRAVVARRLLGSLIVRGVVEEAPDHWRISPAYQDLLATVLDPRQAVSVRVRTPDSSAMAIVCQGPAGVVVHGAGPGGTHELRRVDDDLDTAVVTLLGVPDDDIIGTRNDDRPVRLRYSALLRQLDEPVGVTACGFVAALADYRYTAKLIPFGRTGETYHVSSAVLVAGGTGPLWAATVQPDAATDDPGTDADGWVTARPLLPADLRDWLRGLDLAG
ncbi:hypothetical protein AB0M79_25540 [Polymorphospora sp. NPDC051019]|uniref:hypothetical protein n=1 Tax=Polymorphospora sp. NPDC051019 TaxID=3155725 RepID=UPI00341282DF